MTWQSDRAARRHGAPGALPAAAAWCAAGAAAAAFAAVVALHLVNPRLSPAATRLSAYATGRYGWVMALAFTAVAFALLAFAVAVATRRARPVWRRWSVVAAMGTAALGSALSAVFPTGVSPRIEVLHSVASTTAAMAVTAGAVLWSVGRPQRGPARLAVVAALLLAVSPVLHRTAWTGVGQRALWLVLLAWLVSCSRRLATQED